MRKNYRCPKCKIESDSLKSLTVRDGSSRALRICKNCKHIARLEDFINTKKIIKDIFLGETDE